MAQADVEDVVTATVVPRKHSKVSKAVKEHLPVRWREMLVLLVMVAVCDTTIYYGKGFAGLAFLLIAAPLCLWFGTPRRNLDASIWIVVVLLAAAALKAWWFGSALLVVCGAALVIAFAMALSGHCPYVITAIVFASQTFYAGLRAMVTEYRLWIIDAMPAGLRRTNVLNVLLPLIACVAFGVLFILANPDLLRSLSEGLELFLTNLRELLIHFLPTPLRFMFWVTVIWVSIGLLRPVFDDSLTRHLSTGSVLSKSGEETKYVAAPAPLYTASRNTLVTVIMLFAFYLVFEFATLWNREFPDGFYYAGYAHEGAAWLTVALALATLVLSLVFRGRVLQDPRLGQLRKLAWTWSLLNILLALAVYNRLLIYIGFNGLTRMRIVGIFGISAVLIGFVLVVWKIARHRNFVWLVRRHLWTLALTVFAFALTPVDMIVVRYNVRQILAGDVAACMSIGVKPINSEGVAVLRPLLDCQDQAIRDGVRALLAKHHQELEALAKRREQDGWTAFQMADHVALRRLRQSSGRWTEYAKEKRLREDAIKRFYDYAYQWY